VFENQYHIATESWQAFERNICRLLMHLGYENVRLVGQTNDHGADVTAYKFGKKWLFQAKTLEKNLLEWKLLIRRLEAAQEYKADIPVIVASGGFNTRFENGKKN